MCELAIALLLLLLVSYSGRATARASERPELITEARLVSSADISGRTMLRVQRLWHFIPADASVNAKDRARVHFTFRCVAKPNQWRIRIVVGKSEAARLYGALDQSFGV
jgi:hypothetical protein